MHLADTFIQSYLHCIFKGHITFSSSKRQCSTVWA